MKEWKINSQVYAAVMNGRHTDILTTDQIVIEEKTSVASATKYLYKREFPMPQPSKSRMVSIICAYEISQWFGDDFYEVLDDPELFTDDDFFVPYSKDKEGYDAIITALGEYDTWKNLPGWIGRTRQYCWLEYTKEGADFVAMATDEEIAEFLDSDKYSL